MGTPLKRPHRILVRGCGDMGSAVAHRLFLLGATVIVHDVPTPHHLRRGMAFTDALFDGSAMLEGVLACRVEGIESVRRHWAAGDHVPVCDVALDALLAELRPDVVIDARMRKRAIPEDQRPLAPVAVGLGPGFAVDENCTVAVETAWGSAMGKLAREGRADALGGEPRPLAGVGRERFVYASHDGVWQTALPLGASVTSGEPVGQLGAHTVRAPWTGVLRGLSHDGARALSGQKIIEVDPRTEADVFGLGVRPSTIARGVTRCLGLDDSGVAPFFGFESAMERDLQCIPMSVRMKLDVCGLEVSLAQWRLLPMTVRQTMLELRCEEDFEIRRAGLYLQRIAAARKLGALTPVKCDNREWKVSADMPAQLVDRLGQLGMPAIASARWCSLSNVQRFALLELTREGHARNLEPVAREFDLLAPQG
jgi:xanthine dehydrogenase accessory factor